MSSHYKSTATETIAVWRPGSTELENSPFDEATRRRLNSLGYLAVKTSLLSATLALGFVNHKYRALTGDEFTDADIVVERASGLGITLYAIKCDDVRVDEAAMMREVLAKTWEEVESHTRLEAGIMQPATDQSKDQLRIAHVGGMYVPNPDEPNQAITAIRDLGLVAALNPATK